MPPNTINVARPTKWGNPFKVGFEVATAEEACRKFYLFLCGSGYPGKRERMGDVRQLAGKDLACWCKLTAPCHADVLLEVANS